MEETQFGGVKGKPRGVAFVLEPCAVRFVQIDFVAANGMAELGQVYADLMGPAGFQTAGKDGVALEPFDHVHVGDRVLALVGEVSAAAPAVAAVADEARGDSLFAKKSDDDGQ